jgi:hypothetical protein
MEEEGEELTLEEEEEVMSEVDVVVFLEILVEEVKTQVPVNQVVRELTNQIFSAITVKSMDIMHMSAERDSIIRTSKVKISQTTQITKLTLCLWCPL